MEIRSSLPLDQLKEHYERLTLTIFPAEVPKTISLQAWEAALERLSVCWRGLALPYFFQEGIPYFNHMHSDHSAMFIYLLSRCCAMENDWDLAERYFYLNKVLHGIDIYHQVELPSVFLFVHPVGTVIGKAKFNGPVVFYQSVTIGSKTDGQYPSFEGRAIFYASSFCIGPIVCKSDVVFGAGTQILKGFFETACTLTGQGGVCKTHALKPQLISHYFR